MRPKNELTFWLCVDYITSNLFEILIFPEQGMSSCVAGGDGSMVVPHCSGTDDVLVRGDSIFIFSNLVHYVGNVSGISFLHMLG